MGWRLDKSLLLVIIFFLGFGLVQVYSSSFIYATDRFGDGTYIFYRQLIFSGLALLILLTTLFMPWTLFKKFGIYLWALAAVGIALTYIPGLGVKVGGAQRWIQLPGSFRFEPSELLKVTYPFLLAYLISVKPDWGKYGGLLKAILVSSPLFLLLKQPDFGSVVLCSVTIVSLLFAFGLKWRYLALSILAGAPAAYYLVMNSAYRKARVMAFLDPWGDPEQKGFQIIQSMLGFYSGGITGNGIGEGQAKLFFLPEAHTDFTFAVLGEELGFIGVLLVATLYAFIIFRGFQITLKLEDQFKKVVALGITVMFAFSVMTNMAVSLGLLPTKGLSLAFLSYGGSSLVSVCFALGLLLNIDRQWRKKHIKSSFRGYRISKG